MYGLPWEVSAAVPMESGLPHRQRWGKAPEKSAKAIVVPRGRDEGPNPLLPSSIGPLGFGFVNFNQNANGDLRIVLKLKGGAANATYRMRLWCDSTHAGNGGGPGSQLRKRRCH